MFIAWPCGPAVPELHVELRSTCTEYTHMYWRGAAGVVSEKTAYDLLLAPKMMDMFMTSLKPR